MKTAKLVKSFFTNPFAFTLAAINVSILLYPGLLPIPHELVDKYFFMLNFPAFLLDHILFSDQVGGLLVVPFSCIQWLFIGWFARSAALLIEDRKIKLP